MTTYGDGRRATTKCAPNVIKLLYRSARFARLPFADHILNAGPPWLTSATKSLQSVLRLSTLTARLRRSRGMKHKKILFLDAQSRRCGINFISPDASVVPGRWRVKHRALSAARQNPRETAAKTQRSTSLASGRSGTCASGHRLQRSKACPVDDLAPGSHVSEEVGIRAQ